MKNNTGTTGRTTRNTRNTYEIEKDVEKYLAGQIKAAGGLCWKFTSPGLRGVPDRFCALQGQAFFVEVKGPRARKRPDEGIQNVRAMELNAQGLKSYTVHSKDAVDMLVRWVKSGHLPGVEHIARV